MPIIRILVGCFKLCYNELMIMTVLQTILALLTVVVAGVILVTPAMSGYYLQFFAVAVVGFVIANRWGRKKGGSYKEMSHDNRLNLSLQLFCCGVAILLLVGSSGGLASWMFPLLFIYFFFLLLACPWPVTLVTAAASAFLVYYFTADFGPDDYGALFSLVIFLPIGFFAQKYYRKFLIQQQQLELEQEKITYYNLYAEKQQAALLAEGKSATMTVDTPAEATTLTMVQEFLQKLTTQIDELQKESRFAQNQLVVSAQLTKMGLAIRRLSKELTTKTKSA